MKTTKLVAFGLVSLSVLGLSAQAVQAASYNNVQGSSAGTVSFLVDEDNNGGVVDPGTGGPGTDGPDPIEPPPGVTPPPVVGPEDGSLNLTYYPTFDFGEEVYDKTNGNTLYAAPMTGVVGSETVSRPLFVQVRSSVPNWTVSVSATDFVNKTENPMPGDSPTLAGAQITINGITAKQNSVNGSIATVENQTLKLNNSSQIIGKLTGASSDIESINSFIFGEIQADGSYNAVELSVPAGFTIGKTSNYVADLTWTISDEAL